MEKLTTKELYNVNRINIPMETLGFGDLIQEMIPTAGTPVNAVAASEVLTVSGVVIDGETVVIDNPAVDDSDTYEFCADAAQSVTTEGNIPVDITASVTASSNTLTVDTNPTAGDTMTLGGEEYTFVPADTASAQGQIDLGVDVAATQVNIVAAVNGTDEVNTANASVSLGDFASDDSTVTALVGGTAGDAIDTTETFTAGTNVFSGATLGSGADCTAANAITALVSAMTASDTQGVGGADGAGDTVAVTADVKGVIGNAIEVSETMANGAFGDTEMSGGVDGTVGGFGERYIDDTYEYIATADNTIADANWVRRSIGSTF